MNKEFIIIISALQIITESMPISSSSHLWLVTFFWNKFFPENTPHLSDTTLNLLFIPTFITLCFFFKQEISYILQDLKYFLTQEDWIWKNHSGIEWEQSLMIALFASIITLLCYFFVGGKNVFHKISLEVPPTLVVRGWAITAIILSLCTMIQLNISSIHHLMIVAPILTGAMQTFALLPGISRLATTLTPLLALGFNAKRALFISFAMESIVVFGSLLKAGPHKILIALSTLAPLTSPLGIITVAGSTLLSFSTLTLTTHLALNGWLWIFACYLLCPTILTTIAALIAR